MNAFLQRTAFFVFIIWILFGTARARVVLVDEDGAVASVAAHNASTPAARNAVADFSRLLQIAAGRADDVGACGENPPAYVRLVALSAEADIPERNDAFTVTARDGALFITGATPDALAQGIYWFLRERVGVRWYAPSDDGEVVPPRERWTVEDGFWAPVPAFASRVIYGLDADGARWLLRNGTGNPVAFSHNLASVVDAAALAAHPEWRGVFDGKPQPATPVGARLFQPELHRADLAAYAGDAAAAFFSKNRAATSFALGLQDNVRFSQSQDALRARGNLQFFRGLPNYSSVVFGFMNAAARRAAAAGHGDKLVGCLAYMWNADAPAFAVEKNVAPYVATDRAFWHVPAAREDEKALLRRWTASGARFVGVYDYVYGGIYLVPRPLDRLADWLRDARDAGAKGYFSEAYPVYEYDTAKLWLTARLLWHADADARALRAEWLSARYGEAAADIGSFFDLWNAAWESQTTNIYWLRGYTNEEQGLLATPRALDAMRALLKRAAKRADAAPVLARRIARLRAHFEVTDAFCREIRAKAALANAPVPERAEDAVRLQRDLAAFFAARARLRAHVAAQTPHWRGALQKTDRADPSPAAAQALAQWAQRRGLRQRVGRWLARAAQAQGATPAFCDTVRWLATPATAATRKNLARNPYFAETRAAVPADFNPLWPDYEKRLPADWQLRAIRTPDLVADVRPARGGQNVFHVENAANVHLFQWMQTGGAPTLVRVEVRGEIPEGGLVQLILSGKAHGKPFARETRLFAGDLSKGRTLCMISPSQAPNEPCAIGIIAAHQLPQQSLEFSNVRAERAPAPASVRPALRRAATNAHR